MKTVQMTLEEELVLEVDKAAKRAGTTRSAFTRDALRSALKTLRIKQLEKNHREGYKRMPVNRAEFTGWEGEQIWGDE